MSVLIDPDDLQQEMDEFDEYLTQLIKRFHVHQDTVTELQQEVNSLKKEIEES